MKKKAKRSILIAAVICVLMMNGIINYADSQDYKVVIDQVELLTDVKPFNISGRIMVPVRAIFEAIGATVIWDPVARTVTGSKGNREVFLKIDNNVAKINETEVQLDVPATIREARTFVPLRFVSESLDMDVKWDDKTKTVFITSKNPDISEAVPTPSPAAPTPITANPIPSPINSIPADFKLIINDKNYTDIVTYAVKIIDGQICFNSILLSIAFDIHIEYDSKTREFVLINNDELLKTNVLDREWVSINEIAKEKNMLVAYESNTLKINSNFGKQSNNDIVVKNSTIGGSINAVLTAIIHEFPVRQNGKTVFTGCRGMMIIRIEKEEAYLKLKQYDNETLKKVMYDYVMENRSVFSDYVSANEYKFKEYIPVYGEVIYNGKTLLNISIPDAASYENVTLLNFIN